MAFKNNPTKVPSKILNSFIPIAKLRCSRCGETAPVTYNGICEKCLLKSPLGLKDIQ